MGWALLPCHISWGPGNGGTCCSERSAWLPGLWCPYTSRHPQSLWYCCTGLWLSELRDTWGRQREREGGRGGTWGRREGRETRKGVSLTTFLMQMRQRRPPRETHRNSRWNRGKSSGQLWHIIPMFAKHLKIYTHGVTHTQISHTHTHVCSDRCRIHPLERWHESQHWKAMTPCQGKVWHHASVWFNSASVCVCVFTAARAET